MIDLAVLVRDSRDMQALPPSTTRLASIFADPEWNLDDVVTSVSLDQALTARVLRMANSAFHRGASGDAVTSVDRAAMRIGPGVILTLAVSGAVRTELQQSLPEYDIGEGVLWRHSVAAALATEVIRRAVKTDVPPEAFVTALLHDVGKLILSRSMAPEILELLESSRVAGGNDALHAESEILGVHHGELGGLVAQHWELPDLIAQGITFHHDPSSAVDPRVQRISDSVQIADAAAKTAGYGLGDPEPDFAEHAEARERLGLSDSGFEDVCTRLVERVKEALSSYE